MRDPFMTHSSSRIWPCTGRCFLGGHDTTLIAGHGARMKSFLPVLNDYFIKDDELEGRVHRLLIQ